MKIFKKSKLAFKALRLVVLKQVQGDALNLGCKYSIPPMKKLLAFSLIAKKKLLAFSLIELMISLIIISSVTAAFTPVITKKG